MKRLYIFSFRAFIGPFLITLAISMFILVMQFLWKYIDDLMGKGLDTWIIIELLFYVSASLIPLALPTGHFAFIHNGLWEPCRKTMSLQR